MWTRQCRVLYSDFLFSIVDRELLSTHAKGDASQLLLQLATLLVCLGVCFCLPALAAGTANQTLFGRLSFAWSIEHFLIATTMLTVGVFTVLSWDRLFPSQRDVLVLGPLPIPAHAILLARFCAVATALGLTVFALHAAGGVIWPLALNRSGPGSAAYAPRYTYDPAMSAVDAARLQAVLDKDLADVIRDGPLAPGEGGGLSIGIYQRGVRRFLTYGAATRDSIFQIGSATKPFTGVLLADMVERGAVELNQPVRELLPAAGVPRPVGNEITLLDLVTHHSSLPGMPASFRPANPANPVADFDVSRLYAFLRSRGVEKRADATFAYSNLGFGLLGHALGRRARVDYGTLLGQVITGPLGMPDTVVEASPEQRRRLLQGYNDYRQPIPEWNFDVLAAAGGLRSTAPDMLTWLEANLHPERVHDETLSAAIVSSHQVRSRVNSEVDVALAWMFHPDSGVYEHAGSLLGFTADAFFNRKDDVAVVVLSNAGPGTVVSADVVGEHVRARLDGRPSVSLAQVATQPAGGVRNWITVLFAYWLTMTMAGVFVFGLAVILQGVAAAVLPRRLFLRISPLLQLATFCVVVGGYFLQPIVVRPESILAAQHGGVLGSSPSYWFLGLFQALSGSSALAPLARNAWIGLGLSLLGTVTAYGLSYIRTIRQIAEQPDITPSVSRLRWLPSFGTGPRAAIVRFGVRTLLRSAQHRVILAFFWGIGFALTIIALKLPRGQQLAEAALPTSWDETSVPLLTSSIVMMAFAVLAARLAFAMPRDLQANWIFRVMPTRDGMQYAKARRRALVLVSVAPVWAAWAVAFLALWRWQPALGHLVLLAFLGMTFVETALIGAVKIPCTCTYLPGKSYVHLAFCIAVIWFLALILKGARLELDALQQPGRYGFLLGTVCTIWIAMRWGIAWLTNAKDVQPVFDDEPAGRAVRLELWDTRFS